MKKLKQFTKRKKAESIPQGQIDRLGCFRNLFISRSSQVFLLAKRIYIQAMYVAICIIEIAEIWKST